MIARRFIIKGKVQEVGFRYYTVRTARSLGIVGAVKNLPDGTVEAIAEGSPGAMESFRRQLERGPAYAQVTSIDEVEIAPTGRYAGFDLEY